MAEYTVTPLLRIYEVLNLVPFSKATLYALIRKGDFPRPIRLAARTVAWRESDIATWIASRPSTHETAE